MARLAAVAKALYYPTDQLPIEVFVKNHLRLEKRSFVVLDPCAGEGIALETLAKAVEKQSPYIHTKTYGIELEQERAKEAGKRLDIALHSSFESIVFDGNPDFIFDNPPYDEVNGKRVELDWIDMTVGLLNPGRSMMLVLPSMFFEGGNKHNDFRLCLYRNNLRLHARDDSYYDDDKFIGAFKFQDPYYEKFKQHIVVVQKVPYGRAKMMPKIHVEGVIGEVSDTVKIKIMTSDEFRHSSQFSMSINKQTIVQEKSLLMENKKVLFGAASPTIPVEPLQPMRAEILAAMIAGGMFSGIRIDNQVVRGGITIKTKKTVNETDNSKETVETQEMTAHVSSLDLKTGIITQWDSSTKEFGQMIEQIAVEVSKLMEANNSSICKPEDIVKLRQKFADIHAPRAINGHANGLFENQVTAAATILRGWENQKTIVVIGEMGTGKTITGIASAVAQVRNRKEDAQKIVILLPSKNDIVDKWKEEIKLSCRDLNPTIVDVETISQVREAFSLKGLTFILVKESMLKRTSGVITIEKKKHCFNCGQENELVNSDGEIPNANSKGNEYLYCNSCGVSYQTYVRNDKGNAYASLANYILKHYSKSYVLVIDEAHQFKGGDSARGYASGSIMRGAWRVLIMTGTFYNGYASSMFFLLYRGVGSFRDGNNYDGVKQFVQLYGLEEKITKETKKDAKYSFSGYNVRKSVNVKEIPGIHPGMISIMLPFTVFMKLSDMNFALPPKSEKTVFLDLDEKVSNSVSSYLGKIKTQAKADYKNGDMSLMSQFTWASLAAHDIYPIGDKVEHNKHVFTLERMNQDKLTPKEEAVLRIVSEQKQKGYPVLIYYLQTDRRPIHHRLADLMNKYGMKLEYMPSTVKSRVAFINNALNHGTDAILCNPNLVREGIDLLRFKVIVWFGVTNDAVLVNQANARIYRIGQTHETCMYYLGYNKTYQAERWHVTAQKVAGMSAMHGDVRTGLAALLGETSLITEVQDILIDHVSYDSDAKLSDLPPIIDFTKVEKKVIVAPLEYEDNWYARMETWKKDKGLNDQKSFKKSAVKAESPQLSLF